MSMLHRPYQVDEAFPWGCSAIQCCKGKVSKIGYKKEMGSKTYCRNLRRTSLSLIWALVNFFFFFALNFMSLLSSAPELTAEAVALETAELTLLEPGLESSNLLRSIARRPL